MYLTMQAKLKNIQIDILCCNTLLRSANHDSLQAFHQEKKNIFFFFWSYTDSNHKFGSCQYLANSDLHTRKFGISAPIFCPVDFWLENAERPSRPVTDPSSIIFFALFLFCAGLSVRPSIKSSLESFLPLSSTKFSLHFDFVFQNPNPIEDSCVHSIIET